MHRVFVWAVMLAMAFSGQAHQLLAEEPAAVETFNMLVMDPLAAPLSCPCVEGYAQRDYEQLAKHLQTQLGLPCKVVFAESIKAGLERFKGGPIHLVIGKDSVIRHGAEKNNMPTLLVAHLTGKDGKTTQTGMFVVRSDDPAMTVADLKGYQIYYGTEDCDEKFTAAAAALEAASIVPVEPTKRETCSACSDGAVKIIELGPGAKAATVISSYAAPLLEGCGTVKRGDLRVVGETEPIPFVTAHVNTALPEETQSQVRAALLDVIKYPKLLVAIETAAGFVPPEEVAAEDASAANAGSPAVKKKTR